MSVPAAPAFRNSIWLMIPSVLMMAVGLAVTATAARYFGPSVFGQLNYAIAFVSLFAVLATLGMDSITVKHLVEGVWDEGTVLGTSILLRLSSGFLLLVLVWVLLTVMHGFYDVLTVLGVVLALGMMLKSFGVLELWMQANMMGRATAFAVVTSYLVGAGVKIFGDFFHKVFIR